MMHSRKTHLKMKICSLAAEAVIIKREERKWPGRHPMRTSLHEHRVNDVRVEARCAQLAYGFLRGRTYQQVESPNERIEHRKRPPWSYVLKLIVRFGGEDERVLRQRFAQWMDESGLPKHLRAQGQEKT